MGSNPINLAVRFLLELYALCAYGYWGWRFGGNLKLLAAIGLPVLAAVIWGTFAVPDDPSRSGSAPIPTPGFIRLIIEIMFFALAAWATFYSGHNLLGWAFTGIFLLHYLLSWDRIFWLLKN